jgi:hypothetical protein
MAILKSLNNLLPEVEEQEYRLVNKQRLQGKLLSERFQVFSVGLCNPAREVQFRPNASEFPEIWRQGSQDPDEPRLGAVGEILFVVAFDLGNLSGNQLG